MSTVAIHWFRKGLRLHDNPALAAAAASGAATVMPLFILDPRFADPARVGARRYQFLLEALADLDASLRARYAGARLFVARGAPAAVLPALAARVGATALTYEACTEPYARDRDRAVRAALDADAATAGVRVEAHVSHTLHDLERLGGLCQGQPPMSYGAFRRLFARAGPVAAPVPAPAALPVGEGAAALLARATAAAAAGAGGAGAPPPLDVRLGPPSLEDMGYPAATPTPFPGGAAAGLARMAAYLRDKDAWPRSRSPRRRRRRSSRAPPC